MLLSGRPARVGHSSERAGVRCGALAGPYHQTDAPLEGAMIVKCLIVLSSKSSGSSVLQHVLASQPHVHPVLKTRHRQNETLFWVKAASVLGLPQVAMVRSEVPIPRDRARADLITLLTDNLDSSYRPPLTDRELIFGGWYQLCRQYAPVFLEKSPHHLHQWSALELIMECMQELSDVEFQLVGLVRNPMDTVYSLWRRWRVIPERSQDEWYTAYTNLQRLAALLPDRVVVLRYEDMIGDGNALQPVYRFIDAPGCDTEILHSQSIGMWKQDRLCGFRLSERVAALGEQYGYSRRDMMGDSYLLWPVYRQASHWFFRGVRSVGPVKPILKVVRKRLAGKRDMATRRR
jgi:hypothetical protein